MGCRPGARRSHAGRGRRRAPPSSAPWRRATSSSLEGLSWATWWLDDIDACFALRERAYRAYRGAADACGAARVAIAIGDDHLEFRGERAIASGWFRRARSLLDGCEPSAEHGWLLAFEGHAAILRHDTGKALRLGGQARELGRRLGVVSLEMFALASEGRALVTEGDLAEGMRRLDEAAAAALAGEYEDLLPAGWTCCYLIHACEAVCDYERAAQWCREVDSFSRRTHIGFVNGTCRASYGSVLVWHGRWAEAERELLAALESLTATRPFWRGEALVRLAQLRRRQGRPEEARALYGEAEWHSLARRGLVELALDAGDAATAREGLEPILRGLPAEAPTLRAAPVELAVRLAVLEGDVEAAGAHVEELGAIAATVATRPLQGAASLCGGLVLAAAERPPARRRSWRTRSSSTRRAVRPSRRAAPAWSSRRCCGAWAAPTPPGGSSAPRCAASRRSARRARPRGPGPRSTRWRPPPPGAGRRTRAGSPGARSRCCASSPRG